MSDANERLNEILVSSIEKLDGAVGKGVDFAVEQAPELIQQLLMWNGVKSGIGFFFFASALLTSAYGVWWHFYRSNRRHGEALMISVGVLIFSIVAVANNLDWLKILIAPKLYLLEYAVELAK